MRVVDAHALALAPTLKCAKNTIQCANLEGSSRRDRHCVPACICGMLCEHNVCTMHLVCCLFKVVRVLLRLRRVTHSVAAITAGNSSRFDRVTCSIENFVPHRTHTVGEAYQAWAGAELVNECALRIPRALRVSVSAQIPANIQCRPSRFLPQ